MAQASAAASEPVAATGRLLSLDAFRGLTIALMVLVNTAGGLPSAYGPLGHAQWDGWTLTDTVFPSFVWIVGLSLTLSRKCTAGAVLRRGLIIYLLGLFLYMFPKFDLQTARLLGVLQRIAICYVAASFIYMKTAWRGQVAWIIGLMAAYWMLMTMVPVPGYGPGRLDVEGNLAHYVDRVVLGSHNYAHTKTWDPEGIVSTLPAVATALFGVLAANLLRLKRTLAERTAWMYLAGVSLIALGLICDQWLPINKKLWTDSFALFMAGLDFVVFGSILWLVDGVGIRGWARPFVILGRNAIAVYMASEPGETILAELGVRDAVYRNVFAAVLDPKNASLGYALSYVFLMFLIAWVLHRKGMFIRV
jgi:predicted acyltransferase